MQYMIPQDIEVEDNLIGPLSLRQFGYMLGGGGLAFGFFSLLKALGLPIIIALIIALIPLVAGLVLAFIPFNSRRLDYYLLPGINYLTREKRRVWRKVPESNQEIQKRFSLAEATRVADSAQAAPTPETISLDKQESRITISQTPRPQ
jgi:hypothetical protein